MKPARYAILPVLAALMFGLGGTARADSVGLAFGPAGIYYFDYHSGYYHQDQHYRHDYKGYRHDYRRPYRAHPPYWYGYRSYGYRYHPPVRRFYGHDYHRWHGEHRWGH